MVPMRRDRSLDLVPASVSDYRERARRRLPRQLFDYIDGGSYDERTMEANRTDLSAVSLRQRVLRDVSERKLSTTVVGEELAFPVVLAPVGMAGMFATRGEVQAARAAEAAGVRFCESTVSICGIEEVARATTVAPWFQFYVMRNRNFAEGLLDRAQAVGCRVLVLTVDLAVVGARYRETRNGLSGNVNPLVTARTDPMRAVKRGLDFALHPRWVREVGVGGRPLTFGNLEEAVPGASSPTQFKEWVDSQFDPSLTWDDIAWVREHWEGKIIVKGILDPDDARRAADCGVDGVVVSNHGGRQLDGVLSTAEALPPVVDAVGDQIEVLVDGGVRSGLDVARMLALGARACLVGRAWAWAVAAGGQAAVAHVLELFSEELRVAMALTGVTDVRDLDRDALVPG